MVLYVLTGYRVLGIVYLNQLTGDRHTHTYLITIKHMNCENCSCSHTIPKDHWSIFMWIVQPLLQCHYPYCISGVILGPVLFQLWKSCHFQLCFPHLIDASSLSSNSTIKFELNLVGYFKTNYSVGSTL